MAVAKNLKIQDHQTANVILDFKKMDVVKCSMGGVNVPRDFNRIVEYYMQHYESTITRLFKENGYQVEYIKKDNEVQPSNSDPS
jgi:hypothetical protein